MTDRATSGGRWNDTENDLIVAEYFAMLEMELAGRPIANKAERKRALDAQLGRGIGSIDFKLGNVSAVAQRLGLPPLTGFVPATNFQSSLFPAIERYLSVHADRLAALPIIWQQARDLSESGANDAAPEGRGEPPALFMDESPPPAAATQSRQPGLERLVRKYDFGIRDARNRAVGEMGEALVLDFEKRRLRALGKPDLASKVRWVAQEDGDGAGYDVHSFNRDGEDRLIEVKTTRGVRTTPFFISRNELSLAKERPDHFRLYRLYEVAQSPRSFVLKPPLDKAATLEPETWRARVG